VSTLNYFQKIKKIKLSQDTLIKKIQQYQNGLRKNRFIMINIIIMALANIKVEAVKMMLGKRRENKQFLK
jgi:hypothetical protein